MLQPLAYRQRRRRGDRRKHPALKALGNREKQGVFAGVAGVDGLLGYAGAGRHLVHADAIVAFFEECVARGADDQ